MVQHLMIDIETASTRSDALVLSVGICEFHPYNASYNRSVATHHRITITEQMLQGRHVDQDTCKWWRKQNLKAKNNTWSEDGRRQVAELWDYLIDVIEDPKTTRIWANGVDFDLVVLRSLFEDFYLECPWHFKNQRCMRTLRDLPGYKPGPKPENAHDALADAIYQATTVTDYLSKLSIKKQ